MEDPKKKSHQSCWPETLEHMDKLELAGKC